MNGVSWCRGITGCQGIPIKSHIIPRGFARQFLATGKSNKAISFDAVKSTQHGIFDKSILCSDCDRRLGFLDDYAIEVSRIFDNASVPLNAHARELIPVNCDALAKFVLSVLWRASVSERDEFQSVDLGRYEDACHKILFEDFRLSNFYEYQLVVTRLLHSKLSVHDFYTHPLKRRHLGVNIWVFAAGGFEFIAKLDKRAFCNSPEIVKINGNSLKCTRQKFEDSIVYPSIRDAFIAQMRRESV